MNLLLLRCPDCRATFAVDQDAVERDDDIDCPYCGAEIDPDHDKVPT